MRQYVFYSCYRHRMRAWHWGVPHLYDTDITACVWMVPGTWDQTNYPAPQACDG